MKPIRSRHPSSRTCSVASSLGAVALFTVLALSPNAASASEASDISASDALTVTADPTTPRPDVSGLAYKDARNGQYYNPESLPNKPEIDSLLAEFDTINSYIDETTGEFDYASARADASISLEVLVSFSTQFRESGGLLVGNATLGADQATVGDQFAEINSELKEVADQSVAAPSALSINSAKQFSAFSRSGLSEFGNSAQFTDTSIRSDDPDDPPHGLACGADLAASWDPDLLCWRGYDVYAGARHVLRGEELYAWDDHEAAVLFGAMHEMYGGVLYTENNGLYGAPEDWWYQIGEDIHNYLRYTLRVVPSEYETTFLGTSEFEQSMECLFVPGVGEDLPRPSEYPIPWCMGYSMDGTQVINWDADDPSKNAWLQEMYPTVESRVEFVKDIYGVTDVEECLRKQYSSCAWAAVGLVPVGLVAAAPLKKAARAALNGVIAQSKGVKDGQRAARIRAGEIPANCNKSCTLPVPDEFKDLALQHVTGNGKTVLGKYPIYLDVAKQQGASYFDVGDKWSDMSSYFPDSDPWPVNVHFLDDRIAAGDTFTIALPAGTALDDILSSPSYLAREVEYLEAHGYVRVGPVTYEKM